MKFGLRCYWNHMTLMQYCYSKCPLDCYDQSYSLETQSMFIINAQSNTTAFYAAINELTSRDDIYIPKQELSEFPISFGSTLSMWFGSSVTEFLDKILKHLLAIVQVLGTVFH